MKTYLDEALIDYSRSDIYPFHMPGHKRQYLGDLRPEEIDITEIDGFDNLHHAEGILKEGQQRLASLFGADESFYLVNGSTAGVLAAVCGCMTKGGRLLIGRNCHKSVYHAAYLMEARVDYIYPEVTDFGIQGSITPAQTEQKLKELPDVQAVVITSPTYDGIVSDIETIARIVHAHGIPLIVDAAHGAHFGFSERFPQKAIALGADLSVESLHKTLPCYTQTAALHMRGTVGCLKEQSAQDRPPVGDEKCRYGAFRFDPDRVKRYLGIFQSSSPSYVLMAGIDRCVRMLEEDVVKYRHPVQRQNSRFGVFEGRLRRFYEKCAGFRRIKVFPSIYGQDSRMNQSMTESPADFYREKEGSDSLAGIFGRDNSKILISAEETGLNGQQLYDLLLERYHLQMEMASGHYVTAITTIIDTEEGFRRLYTALREIDEGTAVCREFTTKDYSPDRKKVLSEGAGADGFSDENGDADSARELTPVKLYRPQLKYMEIARAADAEKRALPLSESANRISGEYIYLYPPGIPILVPGELITEETLEVLGVCRAGGLQMQGMADPSGENVQVILEANRMV